MSREPIDIVMLAYNRLDHLIATVDALEARTPEPFRLTIVDNASRPDLREWLVENRHRFHNVILRPTNGHVPSLQDGIEVTTSDPFLVTDPDIIVPEYPEGEPSWLARLLDLVDRHPDFGLIGVGLDNSNRPAVLEPEVIAPETLVDGEIVETGVGTVFQAIRRDALIVPYRSDGQACTTVRRGGRRVGWAPGIRAFHLGWDDYRFHPGHLASKGMDYGAYREVGLVTRPPTLGELARAAPLVAETRRLEVADAAVLELAWGGPAVAPSVPAAMCVDSPAPGPLPFRDGAAGAVALVEPPAEEAVELVAEACRVATHAVVALAPLETFGGRHARDLAPAGWRGREGHGPGDVVAALAAQGDAADELSAPLRVTTLEDRERWLSLFAAGAFGEGHLRLWIWEREEPLEAPERVDFDPALVTPWTPPPLDVAQAPKLGPLGRLRKRADLADRTEVALARLRRRRFA